MSGLVLLAVLLFQTALIYCHHFSPFEKESNLAAVWWGARPGPRYLPVLLLEVCTGLLLGLLVLALWPHMLGVDPLERALRVLPLWVILTLLAAAFHHLVNDSVIRFPRYGLILRRIGMGLVFGAVLVLAALFCLAVAIAPNFDFAVAIWWRALPAVLGPAYLIALGLFVARALAYFLRVIPLAGAPLHAAASTGLLIWGLAEYGRLMGGTLDGLVETGFDGVEIPAAGLIVAGLAALVLAWRLPGAQRAPDAVDPLPLVVGVPDEVYVTAALTGTGATLATRQMALTVTRAPLGLAVTDARGRTLWELAENGLTRDLLLYKIVSIPILYTGNTFKFKWRVGGRPVNRVSDIHIQGQSLVVSAEGVTLRFSFHAEDILRMEILRRPGFFLLSPALSLAFRAAADAHYLGLGQRFNKVDQRGEKTYFFVEEGGVGYGPLAPILRHVYGPRGSFPNGEQCTSFPVPFLITACEAGPATGLFWNTYSPTWLDLAPRIKTAAGGQPPAASRLTILDSRLDLYLCGGPEPLDTIRQYTSLTGRPNVPSPWIFLPWKTRTGAVVEADVFEDIHRFRELKIPLAQVGVEHWQEIRGSYQFSPEWFPHIDDVIEQAHANGMRITIWHFPYMNAGATTHREGLRRGYFLRNRLGLPYQQRIFHGLATVVDYTNPRAAAWHEKIVRDRFYRRGFQGTMSDYAESVPPDCVLANGESGLAMRNAYVVLYLRSMQRAAQEVWGEDYLIYPRAGYAGAQRYVTLQWPGDQDTDWDDGDGLPAAVRAMLNVSMCGYPVHGSDIGGWYDWFTPPTTKELFLRWTEVGTYSPLMRAHGGPVGRNREPWKFDAETVEIYRDLSEEHVRLFPFLYSLAQEAGRSGQPVIRHPSLLWPDRPELYAVEDAWMIGDALYVAPVVRQGLTERKVILPPGEWWDLCANRAVQGPGEIKAEARYGRVPLYLRRGYPLPRFTEAFDTFDPVTPDARTRTDEKGQVGPVVHPARVGHLEDNLTVWLYPGAGGSAFTLFDGTVLRPRDGAGTEEDSPHPDRRIEWRLFGVGV